MTLATAPAVAQTGSVTATGTGQSKVLPRDRTNNASIVAAYDAARHAAVAGAIRQAHEYALDYANALGLKLGSVTSVSDVQTSGFYGPGQFFGPFGPNNSAAHFGSQFSNQARTDGARSSGPRRCTAASSLGSRTRR